MTTAFIIYPLVGAASGTIMGLLGSGAALIIIPAIVLILAAQGIDPNHSMQIAIGTFFAIAIIMLSASTYIHHKHKAIDWPIFKNMYIGIGIGTIIGGIISHHLPTLILKTIFAIFAVIIGFWLILRNENIKEKIPSTRRLTLGSLVLGLISGTIGIGSFTVPFLRKCGIDIRNAVATSSTCSLVIAYVGTATYIITGWHETGLPAGATGYVYWPMFLPIAITSMLFSPIGAKLAHRISKNALKIIYGILLIIVGLKMLL